MNRAEWKAFYHSIRHDAWAFRESHGGYPCFSFTRRLTHNGEEWSFTRVRNDGGPWISYLRKSVIRERTWREKHASEMNDLPHCHRKLRASPGPGWPAIVRSAPRSGARGSGARLLHRRGADPCSAPIAASASRSGRPTER
jgi:hypothetical protein